MTNQAISWPWAVLASPWRGRGRPHLIRTIHASGELWTLCGREIPAPNVVHFDGTPPPPECSTCSRVARHMEA